MLHGLYLSCGKIKTDGVFTFVVAYRRLLTVLNGLGASAVSVSQKHLYRCKFFKFKYFIHPLWEIQHDVLKKDIAHVKVASINILKYTFSFWHESLSQFYGKEKRKLIISQLNGQNASERFH